VWHVICPPAISQTLRSFGFIRRNLLRVLNRLYDQLENHTDQYRNRRDPEEPETFFIYEDAVIQDGRWHVLFFRVNDTQAQGHLFLDNLRREIRPALGGDE
jgi:hypothetical protein